MAFALKETFASEQQGKDIWFRFWTVIGPCATAEENERALFNSPEEAKCCSAFTHPLSFYEVFDVGDNANGDFGWNEPARVKKRRRG